MSSVFSATALLTSISLEISSADVNTPIVTSSYPAIATSLLVLEFIVENLVHSFPDAFTNLPLINAESISLASGMYVV